ncbi:hypothetical protein [Paraliobacillus ryukyuensis]|uniref:hypothetical protein n=1 Tax=Paraliobacillus ryukyuensis TaxID=200904 RepID=UPI0009A63A76|nr:hypothetical protein [Paraliobacillus ryukyuensis]
MKSRILAFFLAFFPGFGHLYLGHKVRGILYLVFFLVAGGFGCITGILIMYDTTFLLFFGIAAMIWIINMIDIIITLLTMSPRTAMNQTTQMQADQIINQNERMKTILLSLIPGMGQFYLGLTLRGLTFTVAFFGIITMVLFVSVLTSSVFLIFLFALPIIWIYSIFDSINLLNKKQAGETLEDKTIIDDFDQYREIGKKSKILVIALSIFPGAGHMYLGLQKRGLQLMAGFLLSIFILDALQLSIFLFIIPIIWFFSFFDALQLANRSEYDILEDIPIVTYLANYQKWIGTGLILLGFYYVSTSVLLPELSEYVSYAFGIDLYHYYYDYFQVTIVCVLLIVAGIKLLSGSKKKSTDG